MNTNANNIFNALQARESILSNKKILWENKERFHILPDHISRSDLEQMAEKSADAQHVTEPNQRAQLIKSLVKISIDGNQEWIGNSQNTWSFYTAQDRLLVSGTTSQQDLTDTYRYAFEKSSRLIINDKRIARKTGQEIDTDPVLVYATDPDSWRYRYPTQAGLQFAPEDLCMLAGVNPLNTYGGKWQSKKETADTFTAERFCDIGDEAPYRIQVVLDKKHGYCPQSMFFNGAGRIETYNVNKMTYQDGVWLPTSVTSTIDRVNTWDVKREWTLASINSSDTPQLKLPLHAYCTDYRLLGPIHSSAQWLSPMANHDINILTYNFDVYHYNLPTMDQLAKLRE